jgi:DnaB-like helicase C terminal domain
MSLKHQASTETRIGALKRHHGTMPIGKLRALFGSQFAKGCCSIETLGEALQKLDESALTKLVAAHENGELAIIRST